MIGPDIYRMFKHNVLFLTVLAVLLVVNISAIS
jgi:hypothetical protein